MFQKIKLTANAAACLLRSYRATAWLCAHPKRWAELQAKEANISPDVARLAASRVGGQFVPIDAGLDKAVQTIADNFYRLGIIDHAIDVSPVFDVRYTAFLQQRLQEKK